MAKALPPCDHSAEEDYIDMDISSSVDMEISFTKDKDISCISNTTSSTSTTDTTLLCCSVASPPHSKEFEFQMSAKPPETEATTSPADELFYKGKLLPLHLPQRLRMVEKLFEKQVDAFEEKKMVDTPNAAGSMKTTPFESCNFSPADSCYVSGELNAEDYFVVSAEHDKSDQKKSWSKKLKLIKQSSSQGLKLWASRDYLKSLFTRSACSEEHCPPPKSKGCPNGRIRAAKKNPFGQIQHKRSLLEETDATSLRKSIDGDDKPVEEDVVQRKSFSGVINWFLTTKSPLASSSCSSLSSSSSSSASSTGLYQPQLLKRSSSVNSEVESSIQGAIAYCKSSRQLLPGRKSASDIGVYSFSAPQIAAACENQERPDLCRG